MSNDIYAAVQHGRVIEFPVTLDVINRRGHSPYNYVPVRVGNKPEGYDAETMILKYSLTVGEGEVLLKWYLEPMSFSIFLTTLKDNQGLPKYGIFITDTQYVSFQRYGEQRIREGLDTMAKAHGYESFESCLNRFSNSTVPQFKAEAAFLQLAYDTAWQQLIDLIQKVKANQAIIPVTLESYDAALPLLPWNPVITTPVVVTDPTPQTPTPTGTVLIDVGTSQLG